MFLLLYFLSLFSLKKGSEDIRVFPNVTNMDIVQYLVCEKSAYTKEEFKAFKSLEAYKNYRLGFVKNLECHRTKNTVSFVHGYVFYLFHWFIICT